MTLGFVSEVHRDDGLCGGLGAWLLPRPHPPRMGSLPPHEAPGPPCPCHCPPWESGPLFHRRLGRSVRRVEAGGAPSVPLLFTACAGGSLEGALSPARVQA